MKIEVNDYEFSSLINRFNVFCGKLEEGTFEDLIKKNPNTIDELINIGFGFISQLRFMRKFLMRCTTEGNNTKKLLKSVDFELDISLGRLKRYALKHGVNADKYDTDLSNYLCALYVD